MQTGRFIDICTLFFYNKILIQCSKKLFESQPVEVFYYTVIVDDSQLIGRETYSHEIVILFIATMVRVLLCFLGTYQSSSSGTMMPVGNI